MQILSITCDNASVNDAMIDEISRILPNFGGKETHIRCFLHVLNLVAKAIIKMFDVPKGEKDPNEMSEAETVLAKLAEGIELEEEETRAQDTGVEDDDDVEDVSRDDVLLTDEEKEEFNEGILPIRLIIVKVSRLSESGLIACLGAALQARLQDCQLQHPFAASVESDPEKTRTERALVSERCDNKMEFDLPDAGLRIQASESAGLDDTGSCQRIAAI